MSEDRPSVQREVGWRRALAALCIGGTASACMHAAGLPQPPLSFAVDMSRAQTVIDAEFEIKEEAFYAFNLVYPFKVDDKGDRARAVRLAGAPVQNSTTGRWDAPGADLQVRLSVQALSADGRTAHSIHDSDTSQPRESSATPDKLISRLAAVKLQPGRFRVKLINQHDAPTYRGARMEFSIVRAYVGK